ncbi:hypothetical protein L484_001196 [Morus notabilis]|uniref:Uncharacterized protein n=1 Tax=Morus notabilis TaxID=981085 RepID=W9QKX4_9ROSA|nr:hypothetical protein L484_001196 [Morus notabilis]
MLICALESTRDFRSNITAPVNAFSLSSLLPLTVAGHLPSHRRDYATKSKPIGAKESTVPVYQPPSTINHRLCLAKQITMPSLRHKSHETVRLRKSETSSLSFGSCHLWIL